MLESFKEKKFKATREFRAGGRKSILENGDCALLQKNFVVSKFNLCLEVDWIVDCQFLQCSSVVESVYSNVA